MIPARRVSSSIPGSDLSRFHVITMVSNPIRFSSRYDTYLKFAKHMEDSGIQLWTCEVAFGLRPFAITNSHNPRHLQLRTWSELWHKENALNLLAQRLPHDWEYVAWIDSDVTFPNWRPDEPNSWVRETVESLQHYQVAQLFSHAIDLGPSGEHLQTHTGFCYNYVEGKPRGNGYSHWHPGYAWAARREAFDNMGGSMGGGLIDFAILGAGDHHMAQALIGRTGDDYIVPADISPGYRQALMVWQERAERYIRRDVGYVPGTILHSWHGKKKDRRYTDRWKILTKNNFDPFRDIDRDYQGLFHLYDGGDVRSIQLRDQIRQYFRARSEDSIDV